jgi:Ca2+-binding EF-hand superfamily protein
MKKLLMMLLLISAPAMAKKPAPPAEPTRPTISASPISVMIAGFDKDGDARVSRSEFEVGVARSFKSGDANGDGAISLIELTSWATNWLGNAYALPGLYDFDREGDDDRISEGEYRAEFDRRFKGLDQDGDGALVRAELILLTMPRPDPNEKRRRVPPAGQKPQ